MKKKRARPSDEYRAAIARLQVKALRVLGRLLGDKRTPPAVVAKLRRLVAESLGRSAKKKRSRSKVRSA